MLLQMEYFILVFNLSLADRNIVNFCVLTLCLATFLIILTNSSSLCFSFLKLL